MDRPELGRVASSLKVDPAPLLRLLDDGACRWSRRLRSTARRGATLLNVNADTAAGAIAAAVGADWLVFLTDVDGVLDASGRLLRRVPSERVEQLIGDGVIDGGMIPKARACLAAAEAGVTRAHRQRNATECVGGVPGRRGDRHGDRIGEGNMAAFNEGGYEAATGATNAG